MKLHQFFCPQVMQQRHIANVACKTLRSVFVVAVIVISGCQRTPAVHPVADKTFHNLETAFVDPTTKQLTDQLRRGQPVTFQFRLEYDHESKFVPLLPELELWRDGKEVFKTSLNLGTRNIEKRRVESDSSITLDVPPGRYDVRCVMLMEERATRNLYPRSFGSLAVTVE